MDNTTFLSDGQDSRRIAGIEQPKVGNLYSFTRSVLENFGSVGLYSKSFVCVVSFEQQRILKNPTVVAKYV